MASTESKIILGLDISSKPGWATLKTVAGEAVLLSHGTLFMGLKPEDFGSYPLNYLNMADYVAQRILSLVRQVEAEHGVQAEIVIEETTASKNNYSQKTLEFIHAATLKHLRDLGRVPVYIRTGTWRNVVGANQNAEEKKLNSKISRIKAKTGSKLAKIDGKVVGRITRKHTAIRAFYEHFGIQLRRKDEDAADAGMVALAYVKGAPLCDGTVYGGTLKKEQTCPGSPA